MAILQSGGAIGADSMFGVYAKEVGHQVKHFIFKGYNFRIWTDEFVTLSDEELIAADPYVKLANMSLKRRFPTTSNYTNNLLRRNYYQTKDSKVVYAVASLDGSQVSGGTAWAVQMAIDGYIMLIYLFDMKTNQWYQYFYAGRVFELVLSLDLIRPIHLGAGTVYTGIGSRNLTPAGEQAIEDLYEL